ncbi:hypothetical protein [Methylobacterium crusticola]|nr:hypothetical protein [Methylobacterium crusticola]
MKADSFAIQSWAFSVFRSAIGDNALLVRSSVPGWTMTSPMVAPFSPAMT